MAMLQGGTITGWAFRPTAARAQQEVGCPIDGRTPGEGIPAAHNMTYATCLRNHGRPLAAEFQSQCGTALC